MERGREEGEITSQGKRSQQPAVFTEFEVRWRLLYLVFCF